MTYFEYTIKTGYENGYYNELDLNNFVLVGFINREFADKLKAKKLEATKEA